MSGQRGSFARVLRNRSVRRVQFAFLGSTLGDWAYATAVVVWAYSVDGATAVGVYLALRFVVAAVAGPVGATIADRVSRRHFMMASDAIRAVLVGTAAVVVGLDGPPLAVFGLALTAVAVGAPFRAAQTGLVPRLVDDPAELTAANAVTSNLETAGMFVGPAIGALLVSSVDVQAVFWLNALTFVWSFVLVGGVRVPAVEVPASAAADGPQEGFAREAAAGFAQLARDRDLGAVSLLAASQGVVWGGLTVFLVMIAASVLDAGAAGVGYLNSVMGVGTVLGGLAVLTRVGRGRLGQDMTAGVLGWSLPLLAMALFPSPVTAIVALVVIGVSDAWVNLGLDTIPQRVAPERIISRVFAAVDSSLIAAMALGAAVAPVLVHLLGLRGAMVAVGAPVTVIALACLPRMRRLDGRLATPEHLDLLRSLDIFAPLPPAVAESLARRLHPASYAAGSTILSEGESSDGFFVIRSGRVEVTREGRPLRAQGPGEYFGEIALLRDVPRTATVAAVEDTEVLVLDRGDFLAAVTGTPDAAHTAEDVVVRRLAV